MKSKFLILALVIVIGISTFNDLLGTREKTLIEEYSKPLRGKEYPRSHCFEVSCSFRKKALLVEYVVTTYFDTQFGGSRKVIRTQAYEIKVSDKASPHAITVSAKQMEVKVPKKVQKRVSRKIKQYQERKQCEIEHEEKKIGIIQRRLSFALRRRKKAASFANRLGRSLREDAKKKQQERWRH